MPALQDKTILIISPQAWGNMFISKHHYALELARKGNTVFFLNPPGEGGADKGKSVEIVPSGIVPGLYFIRHSIWFPYNLKFHALPLFHFLMRGQVKKILKAIGGRVDVVWSFDLGNLYPFRLFGPGSLKIFHPVDEPLNQAAIRSAEGADILFSVTREILDKYKSYGLPAHFINHGVAADFLLPVDVQERNGQPVRVGFSGNLLRKDVDREIFIRIVRENPAVYFECWGSYKDDQSNIGGVTDDATARFVADLESQVNVILHGPVPSGSLAKAIHKMDAFLICYDIRKDQSGGTNYHKIMEYISTGKVIVSNNVTTYHSSPDLVRMVESRDDNHQLPELFRKVIGDLDQYNSPGLQVKRIGFAKDNTYQRQVERIEDLLQAMIKERDKK
jgi:hypothetical protein